MKKVQRLFTKEDFKEMESMLAYLKSLDSLNEEVLKKIEGLECNGFYCVLDEQTFNSIPFEERWYTKYHPTYHMNVLLLKYYLDGHKEVEDKLYQTTKACLEKAYLGHGYDASFTQIEVLTELFQNGFQTYILDKPELKKPVEAIIEQYRKRLADNHTKDGFGDLKDNITQLLTTVDSNLMFVYGTLMHGRNNHGLMYNCDCIGDAELNDYALVHLTHFPGAIKAEGNKVYGELYAIHPGAKQLIDELEGTLYECKTTIVICNKKAYSASFYEYITDSNQKYEFIEHIKKWDEINPDYVWYAAYGSNLFDEHFINYMKRTGSKKESYPSKNIMLSGSVYFAKHSSKWNNQGIAYLDNTIPAKTYGKMYLITRKQLEQLQSYEGASYNNCLFIGMDTITPIYTITSKQHYKETIPSKIYLEMIGAGIKHTYHLSDKEINQYLNNPYPNNDYSLEHASMIEKNL